MATLPSGVLLYFNTTAQRLALSTTVLSEGQFAYVQETDALYLWDGSTWTLFTTGGGSAHNILSATHTDTYAADTPANGDVLTWVAANSRWEAVPGGAASTGNWVFSGDTATISADTNIYRSAADYLKTDDTFESVALRVRGGARLGTYVEAQMDENSGFAATTNSVVLGWNGSIDAPAIAFGSTYDTNLYRYAADKLKTDDTFIAAGRLIAGDWAGTAGGAGDVYARRSATTGAYYFGDADVYLYYDGTSFRFSGGKLLVDNKVEFSNIGGTGLSGIDVPVGGAGFINSVIQRAGADYLVWAGGSYTPRFVQSTEFVCDTVSFSNAAGGPGMQFDNTTDTSRPRINWYSGSGGAAADTALVRDAAGVMLVKGIGTATDTTFKVQGVAGQTANLQRWQTSTGTVGLAVHINGELLWGPSGSQDVNLYRDSANVLKTDDSLVVAGTLTGGNHALTSLKWGTD